MARQQRKRGPAKKRQYRPRRRMMKRTSGVVERASAKQTLELANDPVNAVFRLDDINLSQFDRLSHIARGYQYFRIKKVEYKIKPYADTFFANATGNTGSVPYLYWLIMKSDTLNSVINGFDGLRDAGAKARRVDDKTINIAWRPTVAQGVALSEPNITTSFASYRTSPWLSTNKNVMLPGGITTWAPSEVPHMGLLYGVEQNFTNPTEVLIYGVEVTVHCEFKKPLPFSNAQDAPPAQKKEVIAK